MRSLNFYGALLDTAPDPLTVAAALLTGPDGHKACAIACAYAGPIDEGQKAVRSIKEFGSPVMDAVGPMPYLAQQALLEQAAPPGMRNYWKAEFIDGLTPGFIDSWVDAYSGVVSPMSYLLLFPIHGVAARVARDATAFPLRGGIHVGIYGQWKPGETDKPNLTWVRNTWKRITPFAAGGLAVNEIGADEGHDRVRQAYGINYARLSELKAKYDPTNLFRLNANIEPAPLDQLFSHPTRLPTHGPRRPRESPQGDAGGDRTPQRGQWGLIQPCLSSHRTALDRSSETPAGECPEQVARR